MAIFSIEIRAVLVSHWYSLLLVILCGAANRHHEEAAKCRRHHVTLDGQSINFVGLWSVVSLFAE